MKRGRMLAYILALPEPNSTTVRTRPWQKSLQNRVSVTVTWIRLSQSTLSVKCLTTITYS